jgi:hypothetical protein
VAWWSGGAQGRLYLYLSCWAVTVEAIEPYRFPAISGDQAWNRTAVLGKIIIMRKRKRTRRDTHKVKSTKFKQQKYEETDVSVRGFTARGGGVLRGGNKVVLTASDMLRGGCEEEQCEMHTLKCV